MTTSKFIKMLLIVLFSIILLQQLYADSNKRAHNLTNSIGQKFILIKSGKFTIGSPPEEEGRSVDENQRDIELTNDFYIQTTEVTQGQWYDVMGTKPWAGKTYVKEGRNYPAVFISWDDANEFISKLNEKEKSKNYRLPTEAEWEYVCRSGSKKKYSFGNSGKKLGEFAWFSQNALDKDERYAHEVKNKKPNPFGVFDMYGNTWEWCLDWYGDYPSNPAIDPSRTAKGGNRVLRGGSWRFNSSSCRSANRFNSIHSNKSNDIGFRLAYSKKTLKTATLSVELTPVDAKVELINVVPKFYDGIKLDTGRYLVEISKKGFFTKKLWIDLDKNIHYKLSFNLKEKVATKRNGFTNSLGQKFVYIPPGTFMMGSPDGEKGRRKNETLHKVTLTKGFYIQTMEVTKGQWLKIMDESEFFFKYCGENCPAEGISWEGAKEFIKRLNKLEGTKKYRLPTEAEWEYACRAGSKTPFANNYEIDDLGWCGGLRRPFPVGLKKSNNWGLFDMHGNVEEFCEDRYGELGTSHVIDPKGAKKGVHVTKGGSADYPVEKCRSAYRSNRGFSPFLGFRLAKSE